MRDSVPLNQFLASPDISPPAHQSQFRLMTTVPPIQNEEPRQAARAEAQEDKFYSFAKLDQYTLKQRLIIRVTGLLLYWLVRTICATVKFEVVGWEHHTESKPLVYCFWHNRIPTATYFWRRRGIVVMSSQSFDSEYIARFIQRFGYGTAKGSSTRGARAGLIQMIRAVRAGKSAAFTVDGPRGPIYQAKPGALLLAAKANAAILPFSISLDRCWRLPSWDRIEIPKPFARAVVVIGERIHIENGNDEMELEQFQSALDKVRDRGEELVKRLS
jgi:lysophospholipid acyltransferase (LPLAT)-like uncharacterized protein